MSIPRKPAIAPGVVVNGPPRASEAIGVRRVVLALNLAGFAGLLAATLNLVADWARDEARRR
jgi:hypothetical protein